MMAAVGIADARVWRKPRVAVISTGDELIAPGHALPPAAIYDSNGPIIAAALEENGCEAIRLGAIPDDETRLEAVIRNAHADCDAVVLSGGTSKGAGDLTHRIVARLGRPGIVTHGVALKPGKPLCLAVCDGKPVVVLPGFPTSAMFTFYDIVAPVLRTMAGLPARQETTIRARVPVRVPSDLGRTEFVMVALAEDAGGTVAHPVGKGSGAVTAFSQADGFFAIEALAATATPAGATVEVRLFSPHVRIPDLVIMGSHCARPRRPWRAHCRGKGLSSRILALGSQGGARGPGTRRNATWRRSICSTRPPASTTRPFLGEGYALIKGWRRLQGLVFARGDKRFEGRDIDGAVAAALADPTCLLVNRNAGAGTRTLIDRLLKGAKPPGYWNQPRSHNAVAAAVAQGRADWGVAIRPVAEALGLGFIPLADEEYDFAVRAGFLDSEKGAAFTEALAAARQDIAALGFEPG